MVRRDGSRYLNTSLSDCRRGQFCSKASTRTIDRDQRALMPAIPGSSSGLQLPGAYSALETRIPRSIARPQEGAARDGDGRARKVGLDKWGTHPRRSCVGGGRAATALAIASRSSPAPLCCSLTSRPAFDSKRGGRVLALLVSPDQRHHRGDGPHHPHAALRAAGHFQDWRSIASRRTRRPSPACGGG